MTASAPHHIAVEGTVTDGHLGLIAGGQHQGGKFVGEGHQEAASNSGLNVFFGGIRLEACKLGLERAGELREQAADADEFKPDAKIGGQMAAVVDGARGRVGAGHSDGDDIFGTEGIGGNGRDERGIDASAEADKGLFEPAFAHIVAGAEDQGAVGGGGIVVLGDGQDGGIKGVDDDQVFSEGGGLGNQFPARVQGEGGAVEDEAVVATHLVGHEHGHAVAARDGRQHFAANGALGVPEGGRGQIDVQGGLLTHQLFHRVHLVQTLGPEVLVVPGVLADGDGEADSVQLDDLLPAGRGEVTLLVEYVVKGEEPLVLLEEKRASVEQNGGIDGRLACLGWGGQSHASQHSRRQVTGGRGQFVDSAAAAGEEAGLLKEIGGRIAADGELRKHGEARAQCGCAAAGRNDSFKVSCKIPDRRIDLGQCDLHRISLNARCARPPGRGAALRRVLVIWGA